MVEFKLNDNEIKKALEFEEKHKDCHKTTTIGGGFEYRFLPNAIGTAIFVKCLFCGEEENITDYDLW